MHVHFSEYEQRKVMARRRRRRCKMKRWRRQGDVRRDGDVKVDAK